MVAPVILSNSERRHTETTLTGTTEASDTDRPACYTPRPVLRGSPDSQYSPSSGPVAPGERDGR